MNKKKIAITGGIGSGKSTVIKILKEKGFPVFSCDAIYKELFTTQEYVNKVSTIFPNVVVDGKIDKKLLSGLVFKDKYKLALLNSIAHPSIMNRLFDCMAECEGDVVFAEVPLLFEIDAEVFFEEIWVISRDKDDRIRAVQNRDGASKPDVESKIAAQIDYSSTIGQEKLKNKKVFIIENNSTIDALKRKIEKKLSLNSSIVKLVL